MLSRDSNPGAWVLQISLLPSFVLVGQSAFLILVLGTVYLLRFGNVEDALTYLAKYLQYSEGLLEPPWGTWLS